MTIFAFSLSDTFDTIGTFIGTGRRTGIFSQEDENALENSTGFSSKMDRALFADAIGTSIGALFGTSNTTTYVESAAGIAEGGRTGLTAVSTAVCFLLSTLLLPLVGIVPAAATAPALIIVGVMMVSSFLDVDWSRFEDALPTFFAAFFMALCYSISYGIAAAFIFYCLVKIVKEKLTKSTNSLGIDLLVYPKFHYFSYSLTKNDTHREHSRSWIWFPIKRVFFIVVLPQLTFRKEGTLQSERHLRVALGSLFLF